MPFESVSSQFSLEFAIRFSCHLYYLLPYSSSLSSPNQLQLIWKHLTNDHCVFKNEYSFQSATKYCYLHQSQVFTLNRIHMPSNTAWNFQDLYRTQQNGISWWDSHSYLYAPLLLHTLLLLLLQVALSTHWDRTVLEAAQLQKRDSALVCL